MADEMVLRAQRFINTTYPNMLGIAPLEENGQTSWTVMYALTRALQLELGISSLSNNFGPTTLNTLQSKYPVLNAGNVPSANFARIIQSALYCKGYDGGEIDGIYNDRVAASVRKLRGWQEEPGKGAGGPVDVLSGKRRSAAKALAREQRAAA